MIQSPASTREHQLFEMQLIETPFYQFRANWTKEGLWSFKFYESSRTQRAIEVSQGNRTLIAGGQSNGEERSQNGRRSRIGQIGRLANRLSDAVLDYFHTGQFDWDLNELDWSGVSEFHQKALRSCHQIPKGSVLTYGQLATMAGRPLAARAVGCAMAKNRWPLIIPCHRVVGSNGKLTGYSGLGGLDTKRKLLEMEGYSIATQVGG